ncbi:hypothetical protein, partial [Nocardioides sp. YIM 152588]|uniref:hypothetical protein n=1 Tax=Nocardioides sp. YIM 152588 TaxID=3158259 RepID=UPI0032E4F4DC
MSDQRPLPPLTAWGAVLACFVASLTLLAGRRVHLPRRNVGRSFRFIDGTDAVVYRETVADRTPADPCFLAVSFRLRGVRGRRGHAAFRA